MLGAGQAPARRREGVHPGHGHLGVMTSRAQPDLAAFIEGGLHEIWRSTEELDAVRTALGNTPDPGPRFLGRVDRLEHVVDGGEIAICEEAGRGDLVVGGKLLLVLHPAEAVEGAHVADRRDAMGEPQLVDIVDRRHPAIDRLHGDAGMRVAIDEARRQIFAVAVEIAITRRGAQLLVDGRERGADLLHLRDAAALDDDIDRADGRRTCAVNHHRPTQDEPLVGALPPVPAGCGDKRRHPRLRQFLPGKSFRIGHNLILSIPWSCSSAPGLLDDFHYRRDGQGGKARRHRAPIHIDHNRPRGTAIAGAPFAILLPSSIMLIGVVSASNCH